MILALGGGAIAGTLALVAALAGLAWLLVRISRTTDPRQALRAFDRQRAALQTELLRLAAKSGRPRGLAWKQCDCDSQLTLARDVESGQLVGFVGVTVSFEAIAGGPMEEVEAVGNLRAGTAVFSHDRGQWTTDGRVLFNLDPADALQRYAGRIELIESTPGS